MRRLLLLAPVAVLAMLLALPAAASAATCSDYPNQAAAQRAHDTSDPDHDGIYCESLPCPCSKAGASTRRSCRRPHHVVRLRFSARKYRHIRRHFRGAIRRGWPRVLVINRGGADARRDRLLSRYPTRPGYDRDEYPPAVGRGRGKGLSRGRHPRGWKA